jgi:flagellar biosynthesis protein FlhG
MSRHGRRVLVIDADFGLANVDVMLGVSAKYNIGHVLKGEKSFREIIQLGHEGVHFVSGGSGLEELLNMDEVQIESLLESITTLDELIDFVIIDTGAGINDKVMQMVLASSESIVVTTTEPTAILDAYAMIKRIVQGNKTLPIHVILNKCEGTKEARRVTSGLLEFVVKQLGKDVNPLEYIMFDHEVTNSIKKQQPILISSPGSPTSKQIDSIARMLLDMPDDGRYQGIFSKILSRLRGT